MLWAGSAMGSWHGVRRAPWPNVAGADGGSARRRRRGPPARARLHAAGARRADARLHRLRLHVARPSPADTDAGRADSVRAGATSRRRCLLGKLLSTKYCFGFFCSSTYYE